MQHPFHRIMLFFPSLTVETVEDKLSIMLCPMTVFFFLPFLMLELKTIYFNPTSVV